MDPPYDVTKRLLHTREALVNTPIDHPMHTHLKADVRLHEHINELARKPLSFWVSVPRHTIEERIHKLVDTDWVALMENQGDRTLMDRVVYATEWLYRCIITAARVLDGDSTQTQQDAIWASHLEEIDTNQRNKEGWGSAFFHTSPSGDRLRTPDDMLRNRSLIRHSGYAAETADLFASTQDALRLRDGEPPDPQLDESIRIDAARYKAHLDIACSPHRRLDPSQYDNVRSSLKGAWYALLNAPRDAEAQAHVQLLTDEMLRDFGQ